MPGRGPAGAKVNFRQAPPVGAKGNCQAPLSSTKIGLVDIPNVDPYEPPSPNQIEEMIPGHAPVGWSGKFNDELGRLADLIYAGREFYLLVLAADIRNSTLVQNEAIDLRLHAAVLSRFVQVSGEAIQKVYGGWFDKFTGDAHSPCNVVGHKTGRRDLVLDPMCGIGTTLVEAVHLGRVAVGVEYEQEWADLARANVDHARKSGAPGDGEVITGDALRLSELVAPTIREGVALVLTSPPYGASVHSQAKARAGAGVIKAHDRYSTDPANLAHQSVDRLLDAVTRILASCRDLLRPGGVVVLTVRPFRRAGELIDLPAAVLRCGDEAGLLPYERNVASAGIEVFRLRSRECNRTPERLE